MNKNTRNDMFTEWRNLSPVSDDMVKRRRSHNLYTDNKFKYENR